MENYNNKMSLLALLLLFFMPSQQLHASQATKKIGMQLACVAKAVTSNQLALHNAYPEDDAYNHTVMNGTYFDARRFKNKEEKFQFVKHHFHHLQVKTDANEMCVDLLAQSNYSRLQLARFMHIAQDAAVKESCDAIKLVHLEKAFGEIEYGKTDKKSLNLCQIAYHEAGHAVINALYDTGRITLFASINPNEQSLGYVYHAPTTNSTTEDQQCNYVNMLLAGGITEQVFGLPYRFEFDTEENIIRDFRSRGTGSDSSAAMSTVEQLIKNKSQTDASNCLVPLSKDLLLDLTVEDNFISMYNQCQKTHMNQETFLQSKVNLMKARYMETIELVRKHQEEITAVAQELLQEKVISGKRIKEIIDRVQQTKNNN